MSAQRQFTVPPESAGQRLDVVVTAQLGDVSRSRVQMLIEQGSVRVNGAAARPRLRLRGGERIEVAGDPHPAPLKAEAENIPLDVVYEDPDLAVVNKPAGMMVHAGSGRTDDARSRGTLVNALLHHFGQLSTAGGELRPGIVHRLDKATSGLIVIAKNDRAHAALGAMFAGRKVHKTYIALVHGHIARLRGTIDAAIARDPVRRTRMATNENGRAAVSHYEVPDRDRDRLVTPFGRFTLVRVRIETGRTHQIRVHMASIGHPVVGDTLYGGAGQLTRAGARGKDEPERIRLGRNFLHAFRLEFTHPLSGRLLELEAPLPGEFVDLLRRLGRTAGD
ncbi:MAG TPA: RluA family pseudouridine synthase [Terracidiphilus sp.]|nr:RluA family pseudouridine synthase [Terracidiphilus sp.]